VEQNLENELYRTLQIGDSSSIKGNWHRKITLECVDKVASKLYNAKSNKSLSLSEWSQDSNLVLNHPVLNAIEKFKKHSSLTKVKTYWQDITGFKF